MFRRVSLGSGAASAAGAKEFRSGGGVVSDWGGKLVRQRAATSRTRPCAEKLEKRPPKPEDECKRAERAKKRRADPRLVDRDPRRDTILEMDSVRATTREAYLKMLAVLVAWCVEQGLGKPTARNLDALVARWMEADFLDGQQSARGNKMIAAVRFAFPAARRGGQLSLPRAAKALKGWRLRAPTRTRLPLPWEVVALIAARLWEKGLPWMSFLTVLAFHCYLRPSEAHRLEVQDFVAPLGVGSHKRWCLVLFRFEGGLSSKTNEFDETVRMDLAEFSFLEAGLATITRRSPMSAKAFVFTQIEFAKNFGAAAANCEVEVLKPEPYQLRHSGPSYDRALGKRTLAEIKLRGRWKSDSSVRRYEKAGRVTQQLHRLSARVRAKTLNAPALIAKRLATL